MSLEQLLERHEALRESVELLAETVRDLEDHMTHVLEAINDHERRIRKLEI